MSETFCEYNGKQADVYAAELQEALDTNTEYATLACVDGEKRYLLCTDLTNSEWFLISLMPFGTLDRILENLSVPPDDNTAYVHYYYRWNSNHFYYLLQTVKSAGNGIGNGAKGSSQGE